MINEILDKFHLSNEDILNIYPYGSRVYQTHTNNSDYDFIIVMNKDVREYSLTSDDENINIHLYSPDGFLDQLRGHKIAALECFFLAPELCLKQKLKFSFCLNKQKLRSSISEKVSHSWVKAKKKMEVEKDRNIYIGKKSLFHSFRILDFGMQIAINNQIKNYSSMNHLWKEIKDNPAEDWETYKTKYQILHNSMLSEFRKLAPSKELV